MAARSQAAGRVNSRVSGLDFGFDNSPSGALWITSRRATISTPAGSPSLAISCNGVKLELPAIETRYRW